MEIYVNRPEGYQVDHIIPLRGKIVSGLHVESNLQVLNQQVENRNKTTILLRRTIHGFKLNGKTLPIDRGFTHNDIQYPRNWLRLSTQEDKDALGITWEADPVRHQMYTTGMVN